MTKRRKGRGYALCSARDLFGIIGRLGYLEDAVERGELVPLRPCDRCAPRKVNRYRYCEPFDRLYADACPEDGTVSQ